MLNENGKWKHNHGLRHFVQMLIREEPGTSALTGQTPPDVAGFVLMLCFVFTQRKHKRKYKEKKTDPCGYACVNPVFTVK